MQTFLEWVLCESNYVLNKHAKWGIAVPHKGKDGFKIINGNDHPTATNHDDLAKEHFGMKTDDMLKKHPGTLRYVGQKDDEGKHEFNLELSTHPHSVAAAKKLISHPKHMASFGHPNPHHMYFEFKDKPHHSFDLHDDFSDDRVKDAHTRLSKIGRTVSESAPPSADMEKWIMHRKPEFKKRYGKDYAKYLYGKAWTLFDNGKKLNIESTVNEDRDHHAWYDHPVHGIITRPGGGAHGSIANDYDFGLDDHPRGWFSVDHEKKHTEMKHYGWTGATHTPMLANALRNKFKVPTKYTHETHESPKQRY